MPSTYLSTAIDSTTANARYTFKGDTDLNGTIDFNDLVPLAQNYNQSLATDGSTLAAMGGTDFAAMIRRRRRP